MISKEKILRAICILQIFGSARKSAVAIFSMQFDDSPVRVFLKRDFSEMIVMYQHDQKEMKQKVVKMHSVGDNLKVRELR